MHRHLEQQYKICLFLLIAFCYSAVSNGQYKVKLAYGSNIFSTTERFEFMLNDVEKLVIDSTNWNKSPHFKQTFSPGQPYKITQVAGPRSCDLFGQQQDTVANSDVLISFFCGSLPLTIFKINIVGIEPGEAFSFADEYGRSFTTTFNISKDIGGFPKENYYVYKQTAGPRRCKLTNAEGIVGDSSISIQCDCSKAFTPPPPPDNAFDLISRSTDNKIISSYYESWLPVINGKNEDEGRYVAFTMYGKGIEGSSGTYRQVFWRDRKTSITKLVSKNSTGAEGDGNSYSPSLSADGKSIVFETSAKNLSLTDGNSARDVYLWNGLTEALTHISRSPDGETGNGESYEPVISGDGSTIVYTSGASNIVKLEPVFNTPNVYVYDVRSGTTIFITKDFETGKAASGYAPDVSDDGSKVVFCAYTNRLTEGDNNNLWDIFLWQKKSAGLKRISVPVIGAERDMGTESSSRVVWPAISGDGKSVVFATTSTNLAGNDQNGMQDIFLYNTETSSIKKVSVFNNSIEGNGDSPISQGEKIGISYNGNWITYNTNATNFGVPKGNIVLQNTITGKVIPVTSFMNGSSGRPMLSRHGYYVVAGCSEKYDNRYPSSGLFAFYKNLEQ